MHATAITHTPRQRSALQGGDYRAHLASYFQHHGYSNIEISRLLSGKEHTMRRTNGFDMQLAAKKIGFIGGRQALLNFLKEQGCTYSNNIPHRNLVQQGLLTTETREHAISGHIKKQYSVLLVTGDGLSWLQELADKHGKTTTTLRRRDHGTQHPGGAEGCTPASAPALA